MTQSQMKKEDIFRPSQADAVETQTTEVRKEERQQNTWVKGMVNAQESWHYRKQGKKGEEQKMQLLPLRTSSVVDHAPQVLLSIQPTSLPC